MSLVLVPVSILAAWRDVDGESETRQKSYYALLLVLTTFMVGVFAATDVFLFYVFFEAMLIPMYFLIGGFGGWAVFSRIAGAVVAAATLAGWLLTGHSATAAFTGWTWLLVVVCLLVVALIIWLAYTHRDTSPRPGRPAAGADKSAGGPSAQQRP